MEQMEQLFSSLDTQNLTEEAACLLMALCDDDDDNTELIQKLQRIANKPGRGNAKAGKRRPYILYPPSDVFERVCTSSHDSLFTAQSPLTAEPSTCNMT